MAEEAEPWLRGPLADVHPLIMPVFFSFAQVREDLQRHTAGLTYEQIWTLFGLTSVGFHLKHMAGSVDRLSTYLMGEELSLDQQQFLRRERSPSGNAEELLAAVEQSLTRCEVRLRQVNVDEPFATRTVGKKHLPTTVLGLLVHLAEHTQRHLGQAITLAQILRREAGVTIPGLTST